MVDSLPPEFQKFVLFVPTVHCAEIVRAGFFGTGYRWHYDVGYVVSANMTLFVLGLAQVRDMSRKFTPEA